ncbi:MAG: hypothetical protein ACXIUZ_02055 [Lysobacteraceae bacterium]
MKVLQAVVIATVLGFGTMVLTAHTALATIELRLSRLEDLVFEMTTLRDRLEETNTNVAVLNERLEEERRRRE